MKLIVRHEADEEFYLAFEKYELEESGLGVRFGNEVRRFLRQIEGDPMRMRPRRVLDFEYRRVNLKSFPYYKAYSIERKTIFVLTISHGHQKPEHWIGRVSP